MPDSQFQSPVPEPSSPTAQALAASGQRPDREWPQEGQPRWNRSEALWAAVERAKSGQDYKSNLEDLLKSLLPGRADEHLMTGQEGRGAFALLLEESEGSLLFLGDALSGTVSALASFGFEVTVADLDPARIAFARVRDEALAPGRVTHVVLDGSQALPFTRESFDVVVAELGPHGEDPVWGTSIDPVLPLTRQSFVWITDNALAYKRALGRRGRFEYVKPWTWLARALRPAAGEGTRRTFRKILKPRFERIESLALYPHRLECSHVVRLDAPGPQLTVGPKERRNKVKVWAQKLGAFPWLAPSFAWLATRRAQPVDPRLQRILDGLSERLNAPRHRAQHLIATRGNVGVIQTESHSNGGQDQGSAGPWTLHIPLCAQKRRLLRRHAECLRLLPKSHPKVPIPKLHFAGEQEGLWLTCEQRLDGNSAPQLTENSPAQQRMFAQVGHQLAHLRLPRDQTLDAARLDELLGGRIDRVIRLCGRRETAERIADMEARAREALLGLKIPRVLYHADLRPKHVQVDASGRVLGLMDWGAYEADFLPYVDLLHLFAHLRPDSARLQWQRLIEDRISPWERAVLQDYQQALCLPDRYVRAIEALYPVLVAGMAERNWDFSRPYWVHREFGL